MKKFMFVNRKAPYGTIYALESLEVVLIAATFDQDVSLVFIDDGVYETRQGPEHQGHRHQEPLPDLPRAGRLRRREAVRRARIDGNARPDRGRPAGASRGAVERRDGRPDGRAGRGPVVLRGTRHAAHRQQIPRADHRRCKAACAWPSPVHALLLIEDAVYAATTGRRRGRRASPTRMARAQGLRAAARRRSARHGRQAGRRRHRDRLRRLRRPRRRAPEQPILALTEPGPHHPHQETPMGIEVNGTTYETDEEGYLVNLADWTEDIGKAHRDGRERRDDAQPLGGRELPARLLQRVPDRPGRARADQGHRQAARRRQGQQQVPLRAVPLRPGQAGLQDRRPAQADRLRLASGLAARVASHARPPRHVRACALRSPTPRCSTSPPRCW